MNLKFEIANADEEASSYRADLQAALTKAGWRVKTIDYIPNDKKPESLRNGVEFYITSTQEHAQMIQAAFGLAGVQMTLSKTVVLARVSRKRR